MYFMQFPQIFYEFDVGGTIELRPITDITHNVRFRKEVLNNIALYNTYDIKDGETPDIVADIVYGSSQYHWAVMLFNERFDYLKDWPMAQDVLDEYIADTYSIDIPMLHVDETNDTITMVIPNLAEGDRLIYSLSGGTNLFSTSVSDVYVFFPNPTTQPYTFKLASSYQNAIDHIAMDIVSTSTTVYRGSFNYADVEHHSEFETSGLVVNKDSVVAIYNATPDSIITLTNHEYETRLNDRKRSIKLIDSSLLKQVIKEFKILI